MEKKVLTLRVCNSAAPSGRCCPFTAAAAACVDLAFMMQV